MDFINWCNNNLTFLVSVGIGLIEFIILIVYRKRVKINEFVLHDSSFNNRIVDLIQAAEKLYGSGQGKEKLQYVVDQLCSLVPAETRAFTEKIVKARVEQILATPQKKGVDNNG